MFWSESVGIISKSDDKFWWTLPNCLAYFDLHDHNKNAVTTSSSVVCSPWFTSYNTKWRLALIRLAARGVDRCGIFLWKMPSSNFSRKLTVKLGLFGADTERLQLGGELNSHGCFGKWDYMLMYEFNTDARTISADGFLRFFCEMQLETGVFSDTPVRSENEDDKKDAGDNTVEEIPEPKGVDKLIQDMKSLLTNGQMSDVTLKVENREFKVHRNILIVRSPVFSSMLHHDTEENATGVVNIPNCSAEAFELLLLYIYTGSVNAMSFANIFDLYDTAEKYQVNDLKSECKEYMEENLSIENFCAVMTLSLQNTESGLQKKVTRFFRDNVKIIIETDQWQKYVQDYPVEANELYIEAIKHEI